MKINPSDAAFGHVVISAETSEPSYSEYGLTKRELIAAMAMQGILSNSMIFERHGLDEDQISKAAASFADALIEELSK